MHKFQPYQICEVLAIENWLNEIAEQGYKLTEFGAFFCKFEKNDGPRVYYRARYIPGNKNLKGTFWQEDLYIYHSTNPDELPAPNYDEDAETCATRYGKPYMMFVDLIVISTLIKGYVPGNPGIDPIWTDPLLLCASIACIILWTLRLIGQGMQWFRVLQLSSKAVTVTTKPPHKYGKLAVTLALIPAVIVLILVVAAQMQQI